MTFCTIGEFEWDENFDYDHAITFSDHCISTR
jgi:hypothetical protein